MAITKYASLESAQVLGIKGSDSRLRTASLDKFADFEDFRTEDGYLYARIRAISSRVNKNHDGWPSVELAGGPDIFDHHTAAEGGFTVEADANAEYGYSTFLGKPIFVDHNNSDPQRARGVIVDAKLHVDDHKTSSLDPYYSSPDVDPEHVPGTWVELLLEVDAKSFPKLAKAIIKGSKDPKKGIDGFSMGCDVERSVCSICKNAATSPDEYCKHVRLKGAHFDYIGNDGKKTSKRAYENCYGIKFFEISAVFDPADETALVREVRSSVPKEAERYQGEDFLRDQQMQQQPLPRDIKDVQPFNDAIGCPTCRGAGESAGGPCGSCGGQGHLKSPVVNTTDRLDLNPETLDYNWQPGHTDRTQYDIAQPEWFHPDLDPQQYVDEMWSQNPEPKFGSSQHLARVAATTTDPDLRRVAAAQILEPSAGKARYIMQRIAENPLPQVDMIHAPEKIDTLRDETICPICGSSMDEETCDICGYTEPPEGFDNPDLSKAKDTDIERVPDDDPNTPHDPDEQPGGAAPTTPGVGTPSNPQSFAHVTSAMKWEITAAEERPTDSPVTDEPVETTVRDHPAPVTSHVRTARDFIAAAGRTKENTRMEHTAEAASGAPSVAKPDVNTDVTGVGGVLDGSNEQASKADAQIDVTGIGGTGVEGVAADSTVGLPEAGESGDDAGYNTDTNIEAIPTKTFDDGSSAVTRQESPVTGEVFPESSEGVKQSAWVIEGHDDAVYPEEDGGLAGGHAENGVQPADPVGRAQDRVNVLDHVTSPSNNSGPTTTWTGTEGNGVLHQQDPVTPESIATDGFGKGSSTHIFTAFKLADLEIELGLLDAEKKYARVAELEEQAPAAVTQALAYAQRVKTAGLSRVKPRTAATRVPPLGRSASEPHTASEVEEPVEVDDNFLLGA